MNRIDMIKTAATLTIAGVLSAGCIPAAMAANYTIQTFEFSASDNSPMRLA